MTMQLRGDIDYLKASMTERQIEVAEAMAYKESKTLDQVAAEIGITTRALYNIRQDPKVQQLSDALFALHMLDSRTNVARALINKAEKGDIKAIELFGQIVGMLDKGIKIEANINTGTPPRIVDAIEVEARMKELENKAKLLE